MAQRKIILEELEALNSLKDLAESYEEIAVLRMQKIKDSVLNTRDFLADLSDVFVDLKTSYKREVKDLISRMRKGDKSLLPILQKNNRTLLVYLASNGRLYGSVTQKTYRLFIHDLRNYKTENTDIVVIGRAGKEMFDNSAMKRPYEFIDLPDTKVGVENIVQLIKKFVQYEKVYVYYGKFGNVVKQNPIATSITGEDIFETENVVQVPREDRFIFEPGLEKIFNFFENQIVANLFSQTLLENQLARHASRVNAMEEALIHIEDEGRKLGREKVRAKHMLLEKKQLESISGIVLWDL
jgi:ATP synthase F1 gamma subunit